MTTERPRVKDLSAELGVSNKDLLQVLRELDIQAKSHMSVLEDDDVARIRTKFTDRTQTAMEITRQEVQPGIIVRRRRQTVREAAPAAVEHEEPLPGETALDIESEEQEPEMPATVIVAEAPGSKAVAAEIDSPSTPVAETSSVEPVAPVKPPAPAAPVSVPSHPVVEMQADLDEDEDEDEDGKKKRRRRKKKIEPVVGPQVKIISRPDPVPETARVVSPAKPAPAAPPATPAPGTPPQAGDDEDAKKKRKKDKRVVEFFQDLTDEEERRRASLQAKKKKTTDVGDRTGGRGKPKRRRDFHDEELLAARSQASQMVKAVKRKIRVEEAIRVSDMARQMGVKAPEVIKVLMGLGVLATINQALDLETAALVTAEFGYEVEKVGFAEEDYLLPTAEDVPEALMPRPPVVTIMGHVDHGKTSLLDAIRKSNIVSGEAGGITQHIGAYHVTTQRGEIVFLDTPGHEAFTAMRARGAQVTDIVVLVVAADDGVMEQTREAVNHARAAGVPIVVAVNKIDKEGANPDRVRRELSDMGLVPEDWGGETIFANVSAKQLIGLDELLELILLQAEVLELKANPDKPARGHIVEAKLDKGRGAIGTVLIAEGTLSAGDSFVCGLYSGRVRALFDDQGRKTKSAGPAMPVEVQGFEGVPEAGDEFVVVEDDKVARRIADTRQIKQREKELAMETKVTLETFLATRAGQGAKTLNLVVKADVQGSLEALSESLNKLSTDEVKVNLLHGGVGAISESDIMLASASEAIIIGFNVRPSVKAKELADQEKVDIRFYDIIYNLVNEVKDAMSGMLAPVIRESYLGQVEVRQTFSVPKVGTVAGCSVVDGKITRNASVRLLRDGVVIHTGKISSLKRFKDDVREVTKGYECGMGIENYHDIREGDFIEAFELVQEAAKLE